MKVKQQAQQENATTIVEQMTPALKKEYLSLQKELQTVDRDSLSFRFRLGETIHRIMESDENRYGSHAVNQLSVALGIALTEAYVSAIVYTQWTDDDRKSFLSRTMSNGRLITFSHLVELAVIGQSNRRRKLLEWVYRQAPSTRELKKAIVEMTGRKQIRRMTPQRALRGLLRWVEQARVVLQNLKDTSAGLMANLQNYVKDKNFMEMVSLLINEWSLTSDTFAALNHYIYDLQVELKEIKELGKMDTKEKEQAEELAPVVLGEQESAAPSKRKPVRVKVQKVPVSTN